MTDTAIAAKLITHYVNNPDVAAAEQKGQVEHLERIKEMQRRIAEEAAKEAAKPAPEKGDAETCADEPAKAA